MAEPLHYIDPVPRLFTSLVIYNKAGKVQVELRDAQDNIIESFAGDCELGPNDKLRLRLRGQIVRSSER